MKKYLKQIEQFAKQVWVWMLKKDALIFLLFVGLSSLFWWGHATSSIRDAKIKLPVTYTDIPSEVLFENPLPNYIEIEIRDNGRLLRQVKHTRPSLTISLADKLTKTDNVLHISSETLRPKLQDLLPGSTTVQHIYPEVIDAPYIYQDKKTVAIQLRSSYSLAEQYQLIGVPTITPHEIEIYGSKQDLKHIAHIYTDSTFVENLRDSVTKQVELKIPQGIRSSVKSAQVTWLSEQFTDKSFVIPIQVRDLPASESIHLFPQEVSIVVRVGVSHFAQVTEKDFQVYCYYPTPQQQTLHVNIETNNPFITKMRSNIREVEYIIKR